jgi:hypothetical protein
MTKNQSHFCLFNYFNSDRYGAILCFQKFKTGIISEGIDQPGLALRIFPDFVKGVWFEFLPGFSSVLQTEAYCFFTGKIAKAKGFCFDVKCTATGDDGFFLV